MAALHIVLVRLFGAFRWSMKQGLLLVLSPLVVSCSAVLTADDVKTSSSIVPEKPVQKTSTEVAAGWEHCGRHGCEIVPYPMNEWTRYCNRRFGQCSDIPPGFAQQPSPANGDGLVYQHPDGSSLVVSAMWNGLGHTPDSGLREMVASAYRPTYQDKGHDWSVVSGFSEDGKMIYYRMRFYSEKVLSSFSLNFPADKKSAYDPIIRRLVDHFKQP